MGSLENIVLNLEEGKPIIIVDTQTDTGNFMIAAEDITDELLMMFLKHSTGHITVPADGKTLDRLHVPLMLSFNTSECVSIDLQSKYDSSSKGSVPARVETIRALADVSYTSVDFGRPGHVFPVREHEGGLLSRRTYVEASISLCRLSGKQPVAVTAELMKTNGQSNNVKECKLFAISNEISVISITDLINHLDLPKDVYRLNILSTPTAKLPIQLDGLGFDAKIQTFTDELHMYVVVTTGDVKDKKNVPLRVHSQCLTGDVLRSSRCDCGSQLEKYLHIMRRSRESILIYVVGHEGRGIGLPNKLSAYIEQDKDKDTIEANVEIGCPVDARDYSRLYELLETVGVKSVILYTQNPAKMHSLQNMISEVRPLPGDVTKHNEKYLATKHNKMFRESKYVTIGIVHTKSWHDEQIQHLVNQCKKYLNDVKVEILEVAGPHYLIAGSRFLAKKCDSIITIGIVMKDETHHFKMVVNAITNGLIQLQLQDDVPIVFGILACYTTEQLHEYVYGMKNSAQEWCKTAIDMSLMHNESK